MEMNSILNPYLNFDGQTRAAMEFYKTVFGGELTINTLEEGAGVSDPLTKDNIMHADLRVDNGMVIMAADDVGDAKSESATNCSLSLSGDNMQELSGYYEALKEGGEVIEPLTQAPWGDTFGMLKDRFGILWLVNITGSANS